MNLQYYSLPFALDNLSGNKPLPKCSLTQSIDHNLHLILTTAFGEVPGDENFGCSIWDHDFDHMTGGNKVKEMLRQSLLRSVEQYEKRINKIRVELLIGQEEATIKVNGYRVKKVIQIDISGVLIATEESYKYCDRFYTGPLSYC